MIRLLKKYLIDNKIKTINIDEHNNSKYKKN